MPGACSRARHKVQALGAFEYDTCRSDTCSLQGEVAGAKQDANQVSALFCLLSILQTFAGHLVGACAGHRVYEDGSAVALPAGCLQPRAVHGPQFAVPPSCDPRENLCTCLTDSPAALWHGAVVTSSDREAA